MTAAKCARSHRSAAPVTWGPKPVTRGQLQATADEAMTLPGVYAVFTGADSASLDIRAITDRAPADRPTQIRGVPVRWTLSDDTAAEPEGGATVTSGH